MRYINSQLNFLQVCKVTNFRSRPVLAFSAWYRKAHDHNHILGVSGKRTAVREWFATSKEQAEEKYERNLQLS